MRFPLCVEWGRAVVLEFLERDGNPRGCDDESNDSYEPQHSTSDECSDHTNTLSRQYISTTV